MRPPRITLGVEEEYQLCDPATGALVPVVDHLMAAAPPPLRAQLGYELLHTIVEGNIPIAEDVEAALASTRALRAAVL
ncbi:MAG: carboxylate--amine ligase, partial [Gemmatimonadota bacterium]